MNEKEKEFQDEVTRLKSEAEAGKGLLPPGEQSPDIPAEEMAGNVMSYIDKSCIDNGLTPLNEIQKFILTMGLVGCLRKYNVSLGMIDKYPEAALVVGGGWVLVDKLKEHRAKQAFKEEKEETEAAQ